MYFSTWETIKGTLKYSKEYFLGKYTSIYGMVTLIIMN